MKNTPNISYITSNNLCTGCGICSEACPFHAITTTIKNGCFVPKVNEDKCHNKKGCHKCYSTCPGHGCNLSEASAELYPNTLVDQHIGHFIKCFSGYSTDYDIRLHSASGGLVSQFLIFLLERGYIDGAVVTRFDKDVPLKVTSYIATTVEEVLAAKSSKYGPVTFNHIIDDIKQAPGSKYVIVGLPCHIQGLRKYENTDKLFKSKIAGYFSIFCSSGRSYYLTDYVCKERGFSSSDLENFAYRDNGCLGNMVAKYRSNKGIQTWEESFENYYQPLASFFVPTRCKLCIDHYGELADISFGDIHIEPYIQDKVGVNAVIVRNNLWLDRIEEMNQSGYAHLDEIDFSIVNKSQPMARVKKVRNIVFSKIRKLLGLKYPKYDNHEDKHINVRYIVWYIQSSLQHFIGFNKWMWWIIPFAKVKTKIKNIHTS